MKKTQIGQITRLAWIIRKQAAAKFNCKISQIIWRDCIQLAIAEQRNNETMTYDQWYNFYQSHQSTFNYILSQRDILTKNGIYTLSQELENQTTTPNYKINHSDIADIKQETHVRILEYFAKHDTILYKHRYTTYALCAINAIKSHSRMLIRCKLATNQNTVAQGFNDDGEKICITDDNYTSYSNLRLDLQSILTPKQQQIISLLEQGYQKQEIAEHMQITRMGLYKAIVKIQNTITAAGLYYHTA